MFYSIGIILSNFSFSKPNKYFCFTTPKVNKAVKKVTNKRMIQTLDRGQDMGECSDSNNNNG